MIDRLERIKQLLIDAELSYKLNPKQDVVELIILLSYEILDIKEQLNKL